MLDDYIRGFNRVLSPDQCKSLIDHFESDCEHEKSVQPNRVTRSDKQIWLKDGEYKNTLKEAVTKMLDIYLSEFPYVYRGNRCHILKFKEQIQRVVGFIIFIRSQVIGKIVGEF